MFAEAPFKSLLEYIRQYWAPVTGAVHSRLLKDKTPEEVRRSQLTARLSHLCLLIPALFYLLTLLFLHLLLFLLLPSAAEAVQATEAGTGEGHGLPDAPHPRQPAAREGEGGWGGRRRGETLDRFCFIWQSAKASHRSWESVLPWSLLNTHGYLASKNKKGLFHSFMKIEAKWVFWLELLTKLYDEEISPCLAQFDSLKVCLKDSPEVKSRSSWASSFHFIPRRGRSQLKCLPAQHSTATSAWLILVVATLNTNWDILPHELQFMTYHEGLCKDLSGI